MSKHLARKAGRGFALNLTSGTLVTAMSLVTQLVLAWLLTKHDFGIYAIAFAFSDFVIMFRDGGVARWLARLSKDEYEQRCGNAFLLALLCSLLAGAVICGLSFIVARVYGQPQVTDVMLVFGTVLPFGAYSVVARPRLQVGLRFRALSGLRLAIGLLRYGLTIFFAARGWGAMSFALAVAIVTFFELAFHAVVSRPRIRGREISLRGCYGVFQQSRWSLSGSYTAALLREADYAVLGLFVPTPILGTYYFAAQLTLRPVLLFSESMRWVILPVFSRVSRDSAAETRGLRYGGAFLGAVAAPVMLLICVAAEPLTELLWRGRWAAAVAPIQILALAMPFHLLAMFVEALSQSRGRFRSWTAAVFVRALGRGLAALAAAFIAGGSNLTLIAGIMSAYIAASGVVQTFALLRDMRVASQPLFSRFTPPTAAGLLVAFVVLMVLTAPSNDLVGLALGAAAFLLGLALAFAAFCRSSVKDLVEILGRTLEKRRD